MTSSHFEGSLREIAVQEIGGYLRWDHIDEFRKVKQLTQRVREWIIHYKYTRVVCTLASLEQAIVRKPEIETATAPREMRCPLF